MSGVLIDYLATLIVSRLFVENLVYFPTKNQSKAKRATNDFYLLILDIRKLQMLCFTLYGYKQQNLTTI